MVLFSWGLMLLGCRFIISTFIGVYFFAFFNLRSKLRHSNDQSLHLASMSENYL